MMFHAVDRGLLHPSSFGSTPGRTCQEASLQKILMMDMLRLRKDVGGIFDCDATGCFDRIMPALQTAHTRRLGLASSISTLVAKLMWHCKRFARTRAGVSSNSISTMGEMSLYGIGQRNGGGPTMWIAHLIVMFSVLQKLTDGMDFESPVKGKSESTMGVGYMDDVTLGVKIKQKSDQVK